MLLIDTARHLICRIEDFRIVLFNEATLTRLAVEGAVALDDMPSWTLTNCSPDVREARPARHGLRGRRSPRRVRLCGENPTCADERQVASRGARCP